MGEFRMPSLGADMDAGTVTEWRVQPGDSVRRGDIVAVVDTDKADLDVEVFESGVVDELLVPAGHGCRSARRSLASPTADAVAAVPTAASASPAVVPAGATRRAGDPTDRARAAPAARRDSPRRRPLIRHLAEQRGVDLRTVHGSGTGARITRDDVLSAPERAARRKITPALGGWPAPSTSTSSRSTRASPSSPGRTSERAARPPHRPPTTRCARRQPRQPSPARSRG